MNFSELEGRKQFATITIQNGNSYPAEIFIKGRDSHINIFSNSNLQDIFEENAYVHAHLPNGMRLTFVQCIRSLSRTHYHDGEYSHLLKIVPRYVILGHQHLSQGDKVSSISVVVEDFAEIFYDYNAFGYAPNSKQHIDRIAKDFAEKYGEEFSTGEHPVIAYYTGKVYLFEKETVFGKVSAFHAHSYGMSGPKGVEIKNEISLNINLAESVEAVHVTERLTPIMRFLQVVSGRRQRATSISIQTGDAKENRISSFYWCWQARKQKNRASLSPQDLPLNGGLMPQLFTHVLAEWLQKDLARHDARAQYAACHGKEGSYDIDRLVAAANMFDILPADCVPSTVELSPALIERQEQARQKFRELPKSPERDSILSALGRLGRPNLKHKIRYRCQILLEKSALHFPDLNLVVDEAVNCRNHYVHGSDSKLDYDSNFSTTVLFFTDTLEFVFGASEFIEAGWDLEAWAKNGTTMSHPWGRFMVRYTDQLRSLKKLLAKELG